MGQEGLVLFAVRVQGEPNVVARDRGTPVWETSTRLASPTTASLGTTLMVPEATDSAVVTKWTHPLRAHLVGASQVTDLLPDPVVAACAGHGPADVLQRPLLLRLGR